jgi:hypothetical protein
MKIRKGFVSNSSSSSFIVGRNQLSEEQVNALLEKCNRTVGEYDDSWSISINEWKVSGFTTMRNNTPGNHEGDLADWLREMGYPVNAFEWEND